MNRRQSIERAQARADTRINLCLAAAEAALMAGDYEVSERMYTRGLSWCEQRYGAQSAAVGLVLFSLIELYEKDGKRRSTERWQYRINTIFRRYFFQKLAAKYPRAM